MELEWRDAPSREGSSSPAPPGEIGVDAHTPAGLDPRASARPTPGVVKAIGPVVGNRALARFLHAGSATSLLQRGPPDETATQTPPVHVSESETTIVRMGGVFVEGLKTPAEQEEAEGLLRRIEQHGVALSSVEAVKQLSDKYRNKQRKGQDDPPPADVFETVVQKITQGQWRLDELRGLEAALTTPFAGGMIHHLKQIGWKAKMVRPRTEHEKPPPSLVEPKPSEQTWTFGKTTTTLSNWKPDEFTQAETVPGSTAHTVAITGNCAVEKHGVEIPDKTPVAQIRALVVHELGHTFFAGAHQARYSKLFHKDEGIHKGERPPTTYALDNTAEDFCESFMLYVLYPGELGKCPERLKYFRAMEQDIKQFALKRASEAAASQAGSAAGPAAVASPPGPPK